MKIPAPIIGIILLFCALTLRFFPREFLLDTSWGIAFSFLLGVICIFFKVSKKKKPFWLKAFTLIFIVVFGLTFFHAPALELRQLAEKNLYLPKVIEEKIEIKSLLKQQDYQRVIGEIRLPTHSEPQFLYLNWKAENLPQQGEIWQAQVRLYPLFSRLNVGGFDRQQWFFSQKITALGTVKKAQQLKKATGFRERLIQKVFKQTENLSQQGLLLALAFGERAWFPREMMAVYQQTNTAHLIAISGLHIGLSLALGFWLGRGVQCFFPTQLITPFFPRLLGVLLAGNYAFLAGFQITTLRAFFALMLWLFLFFGRRRLAKGEVFLWVVLGLLLLDPLSVLSGSFWLSVSAVGSLMLWYHFFPFYFFYKKINTEKLSLTLKSFHFFKQVLFSLCHLQLGLLWLFTPVQLFFFDGINLFSPIINLLVVPLFSFLLVPLVLLAVFLSGFSLPYLWQGANVLAENIFQGLRFFTGCWLDFSFQQSAYLSVFCVMSFMLMLCFQRKKIKWAVVLVSGVLLVWNLWNLREKPLWQITMLDVGQGLAVLVEKGGRATLYDTGNRWQGGSMAEVEIIPYLKRQGITLEEVIISHDDQDHLGGLIPLLKHFSKTKVRGGSVHTMKKVYQQKNSAQIIENFLSFSFKPCVKGKNWQWQGLNFEVLWNGKLQEKSKNEDSCVIKVSDGRFSALLMGDAPKKVEWALLPKLSPVDVLQVGHHGSLTSSDEGFLKKIHPKIAMVSASRWNPWGHPNPKVVKRFESQKIPLFNTGTRGSIQIQFFENRTEIHTAREPYSPWFRAFLVDREEKRVKYAIFDG